MNNSAEVYFSYNLKIINKNNNKDTFALANGWEPVTATVDKLLDVIKAGVAYSAWFKDGARKHENFLGTNLVSIDVDGTNQIDAAIEHEFSKKHLTALYTTASHTAQEHRFRLIFRLERVIESTQEYRNILRALQLMYSGDRAAAEPARMFYGNDQAEVQSWGRYIPNDVIDHLMKLNVPPQWDNNNYQSDYASSRSEAKISLAQMLITSDGQQVRFGDIADRTSIFCPHHHDEHASAFVRILESGLRFLHCAACHTTWFQANPLVDTEPEIKLDFVETLRSVKSMSGQELQTQLAKLPVAVKASDLHDANIIFLNQKYVDVKTIQPGLTLIKSPKGSGKTQSLVSVIEKIYFRKVAISLEEFELTYDDEAPPPAWETGKTVLLIGHRQALIRSMCKRLDLNCYLDEGELGFSGEKLDFRKRFGVCLDSIKKITGIDSPRQSYDLVIIDEVEQVLAHLLASTSRDGPGYLKALGQVVGRAESVIAMDADLGWTSFLTLNSMRNQSLTQKISNRNEIYINEHAAENRPFDIYDLKSELIAHLYSDIVAGKRVFVSTNSKKQVDRLALALGKKMPDRTVIAITSENSSSKRVTDFVANIPTEARKYDVVISSPSLGTGIDITFPEDEELYDSVYGIYDALVNSHTEIDQQLSRVRHPKSVKVWVSPRWFNFETHFDVIKSDLLCSNVIANTSIDRSMPVADQVFDESNMFLRTAALILSSQRESKNNLKKNFIAYKKSQGWIPNVITAPNDKPLGLEVARLGKILEEQAYAEHLIGCPPINQSEFLRIEEALQNEELVSADEYRSYQRMKLEIFYCRQIDSGMIAEDNRWKLRKQFWAYNRLMDTQAILEYQRSYSTMPTAVLRKHLSVLPDEKSVPILLRGILLSTPVFSKNGVVTSVEFTRHDLVEFSQLCIKLKSIIERQLDVNVRVDVTTKPTSQLAIFLNLIGIKIIKARTEKSASGGKTYFYKINPQTVQRMTDLNELEPQRKNPWEAINARYGFTDKNGRG